MRQNGPVRTWIVTRPPAGAPWTLPATRNGRPLRGAKLTRSAIFAAPRNRRVRLDTGDGESPHGYHWTVRRLLLPHRTTRSKVPLERVRKFRYCAARRGALRRRTRMAPPTALPSAPTRRPLTLNRRPGRTRAFARSLPPRRVRRPAFSVPVEALALPLWT